MAGSIWHTSESEWEAQLWIDAQIEQSYVSAGSASQTDVDELNRATAVVLKYPDYIMEKVRQHLGLESYDTSRDAEINGMTHDSVFDHVLEWEGIIGYQFQIVSWVAAIYGISKAEFS